MTVSLQGFEIPSSGLRVGWDSAAITRTFRITNTSDEEEGEALDATIELHTAASHESIPGIGTFHPSLPYAATEIRADYVDPSSPYIVDVVIEYRASLPTAGAINFTQIQISPTITGVDIWTLGAALPAEGRVTTANEVIQPGDGTCVSLSAIGVTLNIITGTMSISYEQPGLPGFTWLMNQAGSRNSGPFVGFNTGALLYMGPSVRRIGAVVGSFDNNELGSFEDAYFCRQYIPLNSAVGGIPVAADGCIHNLKWFQPYTNFADFTSFGIQGLDGL